jgi:flagellar FliL protein
MSEEAPPPAAEAAAADAAGAKQKPADAPVWMLALVVVLALGAGSALGALLIAPNLIKAKRAAAASAEHGGKGKHDKKKKDKKDAHGKGGESKSYKIENVIVNPADSQGQRFLMCSLAIEADDPKALEVLREHEVEVRDRVVTALTAMTLDELTRAGARDSIRATLVRTIHPVLGEDGEDVELKIFLPSFVIQ